LAANVKGKAPFWGFILLLFCATIPLLKQTLLLAIGGTGAEYSAPQESNHIINEAPREPVRS